MVTFVPEFVNCENASEASLEDVAGMCAFLCMCVSMTVSSQV